MAYRQTTHYNNIFSEGNGYQFSVEAKELTGNIALNVRIVFTIEIDTTTQINVPNLGTITSVTLPVGTYAANTWTLGNISNVEYEADFLITISSNDVKEIRILYSIISDSNEDDQTNNTGLVTFEGSAFSELNVANEKIFELSDVVFANKLNPLISEVETWVDTNLSNFDSLNGTVLTYNAVPYFEDVVWNNINHVIDLTLDNVLTAILINDKPVSLTGVGSLTSSTFFDEVVLEANIEAFLTAENIIYTSVTVTDTIDLSDDIGISIVNPIGIYSIVYVFNNPQNTTYNKTINILDIRGRKTPSHIWVLNNNADSLNITRTYTAPLSSLIEGDVYNGNIFYIDPFYGSDEEGEIGDQQRPFKTLEFVNNRLSKNNDIIHIKLHTLNHTAIFEIGYFIFTIRRLYIDCEILGDFEIKFLPIITTQPSKIIISGNVRRDLESSFIKGLENIPSNTLILKDLIVVALDINPVDIVDSGTASRGVIAINTKTNILDSNAFITYTGETIFRNAAIYI